MGDFDLARHQPHPPGYPLYIASGWLAHHLLPLGVPAALQLVSALGGGLFAAGWFVLIARRFGRFTAFVATGALATLLVTWMTATKALTDAAGAGALALMLLCADTSRRDDPPAAGRWLGATAAAGAVAVGVRPQNIGVVLLILVLTILAGRPPAAMRRRWAVGVGVFAGANLLWLLPTMFLQGRRDDLYGGWLGYPRLLLLQWRWRLDQPKAFIGAEVLPGAKSLWFYRVDHHVLGLLTRGFGFPLGSVWGWLGVGVLATGWGLYALGGRVRWLAASAPTGVPTAPRTFWAQHLPWAAVYYLTIFCFLPGDQRYYLPIFPLLILPAVLGWQTVRPNGRSLAIVVPAATLAATLPFIGPNRTQPCPPVQMIRWLQAQHPPGTRSRVRLLLRDGYRHAQWYAPDFQLVNAAFSSDDASAPTNAVYTDDPVYAAAHPGFLLIQTFQRSPLIYRKHSLVKLYGLIAHPP